MGTQFPQKRCTSAYRIFRLVYVIVHEKLGLKLENTRLCSIDNTDRSVSPRDNVKFIPVWPMNDYEGWIKTVSTYSSFDALIECTLSL